MDIEKDVFENDTSDLPPEFEQMSAADIERRTRLLDNEVRVLREETQRLTGESTQLKERIRENKEKIKLNNQLPYLVSNIVEVLDINPDEEDEEDGATMDVDAQRQGAGLVDRIIATSSFLQCVGTLCGSCLHCAGKCVVLKTSTRQTVFLPVIGLVEASALKPNDLVGVNKDSYLVLDKLPAEYDSRVKAMEVWTNRLHAEWSTVCILQLTKKPFLCPTGR